MDKGLKIGVIGATGAVGGEFIQLFSKRNWNVQELRLLASPRSKGTTLNGPYGSLTVGTVEEGSFEGLDLALFSAGSDVSHSHCRKAAEAGCLVVDNSSAFRMDNDVPLVVPEINGHAIQSQHRLIANPNCSAIVLLMAVAPLRALGKIRRIIVSTYQSASGGGQKMMDSLLAQTQVFLRGEVGPHVETLHPYAFNLFSHNTPIGDDGMNGEEAKIVQETAKILEDTTIGVSATCVRVPVLRAHTESINVEFEGAAPDEDEIRAALDAFPGVRVVDDRENNLFPMPVLASGQDDVLVGRIRKDPSHPGAINMLACGDQLLKGAALNAVQIAELVLGR